MEQVHDLARQFFGKPSYRGWLAIIIVVGGISFLFALLFVPIPEQNQNAVNVAMGFVLSIIGVVATYYFGSSKDKSDQEKANNVSSIVKSGTTVDDGNQ